MAIRNNQLLNHLEGLRNSIKDKLKSEGLNKNICTDNALEEMAKKKPERLSDFLAISGLDRDFLEMYAHLFLDVILSYTKKRSKRLKFQNLHHLFSIDIKTG